MKPPALQALANHVEREWRDDFGVKDRGLSEKVAQTYLDVSGDPAWRFEIVRRHAPEAENVLDLASGFGTALFHALTQGYQAFGIEPDTSKQALAREVLHAAQCPVEWRKRQLPAFGEALPFRNGVFDVVMSYQTLEHVRNPKQVLAEMLRVLKPGGALHLHCPDYSGTYEGHYLLPWIPGLPKGAMATLYRMLGRPVTGLQGIYPITRKQVLQVLRQLENQTTGLSLRIIDLEAERGRRRVQAHRLGALPGVYLAYRILTGLRRLFRSEKPLHLWVVKR